MALIVPNPKLEEELAADPEFRAALSAGARTLRDAVKAATPIGSSGHARESVEVVESEDAVLVASTDIAGHIIEWGSIKNPAYAPLRRGARNAGFRLDEH